MKTIEELLDVDPSLIHNLVAFVGDATPKTEFPETVLWGARAVSRYIYAAPERMIPSEDMFEIAKTLEDAAFAPGRETDRAHVAGLQERELRKQNDPNACPKCGEPLILRTARKTGEEFMGCSLFPKCRGTRRLN